MKLHVLVPLFYSRSHRDNNSRCLRASLWGLQRAKIIGVNAENSIWYTGSILPPIFSLFHTPGLPMLTSYCIIIRSLNVAHYFPVGTLELAPLCVPTPTCSSIPGPLLDSPLTPSVPSIHVCNMQTGAFSTHLARLTSSILEHVNLS